MSDLYVIVHTDQYGQHEMLGIVVYDELAKAEERVAERRRTAEAKGWTDQYHVCRLASVRKSWFAALRRWWVAPVDKNDKDSACTHAW